MFKAFVTISGCGEDECYDYLNLSLEREFDTFDDALRFYRQLYVQPWGTLALHLHNKNPDLVQIEAEYDIYEDNEPVGDVEWFVNEAIWWKE